MGVPEDQRPPRHHVVDVGVVVEVGQRAALGRFHEKRRSADRLEGAHRRIDAARNDSLGASEGREAPFEVHARSSSSWARSAAYSWGVLTLWKIRASSIASVRTRKRSITPRNAP